MVDEPAELVAVAADPSTLTEDVRAAAGSEGLELRADAPFAPALLADSDLLAFFESGVPGVSVFAETGELPGLEGPDLPHAGRRYGANDLI